MVCSGVGSIHTLCTFHDGDILLLVNSLRYFFICLSISWFRVLKSVKFKKDLLQVISIVLSVFPVGVDIP